MNKFDEFFFGRYVSEGSHILQVVHQHLIVIIDKIIINYFFGAILPSFLYYYSDTLKSNIPFFVLEIFLILMFFRGLYLIFDWYNDAWIITEDGVVDLDWSLFNSNNVNVKYSSIEGLEFIEKGFLDVVFGKGDLVIHKIGGGNKFILEDASQAMQNLQIIDKKLKEIKKKKEKEEKSHQNKPEKAQNFDTVVQALSKVVEGYLTENGYKKDDSKEKQTLIQEVKKKGGAIDLSK